MTIISCIMTQKTAYQCNHAITFSTIECCFITHNGTVVVLLWTYINTL